MLILLENIGFKEQDVLLILFCPLFSAIGSLVSIVMEKYVLHNSCNFSNVAGVLGRIFIGSAIGLVLALYLSGAISEGRSTVPRIFALAILVGYSAPKLWSVQNKAIESIVEKKIEKILEKGLPTNTDE